MVEPSTNPEPQTTVPESTPAAAPNANGTAPQEQDQQEQPQQQQPEDVEMGDTTPAQEKAAPPTPPASKSATSNLAPASAPTPTPTQISRVNSPHPGATSGSGMPARPNVHGGPTRVYLNQNVTPYLLEGMKHLVTIEPDKPLKWLSEYLAAKSAEVEGP